ncbi:MAG: A24 family peptidase [Pirellulaceae bacterium]
MISLILFCFGALIGTVVNWAIYQLCYFRVRSISPFSTPDEQASRRQFVDYLPIVGWLRMKSDSAIHGRGFWIRPMLIEVTLGCFAVWFYQWQIHGGLIGGGTLAAGQGELWYAAHMLLVVLLTIATFIDFDEQTIPDAITIPGTIAGLLFAVFFPAFHLPQTVNSLQGGAFEPMTFVSPASLDRETVMWIDDWRGLALGVGVLMLWAFALMPKICTMRYGLLKGIQYMVASMSRPRRKSEAQVGSAPRRPFGYVWMLLGLGILLSIGYTFVWFRNGPIYISLLHSVLGLAMGGGIVWAVRILAGAAYGQEAMGFGDVTLMAMIGTFVGWQPSLLIFGIAPCAAVGIALVQFIVSKNRALAFGPYLAAGTIILILFWDQLWNDWARKRLFADTQLILGVVGVSLVVFAITMFGMRLLRGPADFDDASTE